MMKTNLPPQAYTREVFTNAYEWLQTQSRSVKELAQTPDDLVALYLQARRHGHLSTSYNGKSFKSDLKNLAEGLRQFDETQAASAVTEKVTETTKHSVTFTNHSPPPNVNFKPTQIIEDTPYLSHEDEEFASTQFQEPPLRQHTQPIPDRATKPPPANYTLEDAYEPPPQRPTASKSAPHKKAPAEVTFIDLLDTRSKEIVEKAQSQLNLSRREEALRMLLVLGLEKLKDILPSKD